jgi:hypothetical protein
MLIKDYWIIKMEKVFKIRLKGSVYFYDPNLNGESSESNLTLRGKIYKREYDAIATLSKLNKLKLRKSQTLMSNFRDRVNSDNVTKVSPDEFEITTYKLVKL